MIDGNPNEFIDKAYTGQDIIFIYHEIKYWFQGYTKKMVSATWKSFNINCLQMTIYGNIMMPLWRNV